ncbi:hypothetical protein [Nodosilinea sp. LEGE 07088]|uniref:hypothetical protein n=1 Tax=Nodosilinea sp. LEGE 07088 TaxID=2777968 RepID=UPI001D137489|nr:hypothetical protein [Nodosilinea sp. LEGE 07088]
MFSLSTEPKGGIREYANLSPVSLREQYAIFGASVAGLVYFQTLGQRLGQLCAQPSGCWMDLWNYLYPILQQDISINEV